MVHSETFPPVVDRDWITGCPFNLALRAKLSVTRLTFDPESKKVETWLTNLFLKGDGLELEQRVRGIHSTYVPRGRSSRLSST